jgi:hypothetical protein
MSFTDLPRMLVSDTEGWQDVARLHPSSVRLMTYYVLPMSLIPPLMFLYAAMVQHSVFPPMVPAMTTAEALVVAGVFLAAEVGMVLLMGTVIEETGELVGSDIGHEQALLLAAIAPTPLWLAPLALFVPSLAVNLLVLGIAWLGSAALVHHGVPLVLGMTDKARAGIVARHVLVAGVLAWIALMVVQVMLMSLILGWR